MIQSDVTDRIGTSTVVKVAPVRLVPRAGLTPGLYQVIASANTDVAVAIPSGARSLLLWFETSASDNTLTRGRVAFATDATLITPLTGTDVLMAHHPSFVIEYQLPKDVTHLHVAAYVAGVVARGQWMFS